MTHVHVIQTHVWDRSTKLQTGKESSARQKEKNVQSRKERSITERLSKMKTGRCPLGLGTRRPLVLLGRAVWVE